VVCTIDLAASFAALTGADLPADACLDSFNVLGALLGQPGAKGREHLIQQDNGSGGNFGFRVGNWKLQRHDSRRKRNAALRLETQNAPRLALFDLSEDPGEKNNVTEEHPDVAQRLANRLERLIRAGRSRGE